MPAVDQILAGLRQIANTWRTVAVFWHVYFGALAAFLAVGLRPSRRLTGALLVPPLLSVGAIAWLSRNPFNGAVFAGIGIALLIIAVTSERGGTSIAAPWYLIPGLIMFAFGWIYPHFLETSSFVSYLYSAPTGLIPCPTLSIVIGSALIIDGLGRRAFRVILGLAGLFYGITGVAQLHVALDWFLLFGAAAILVRAFAGERTSTATA